MAAKSKAKPVAKRRPTVKKTGRAVAGKKPSKPAAPEPKKNVRRFLKALKNNRSKIEQFTVQHVFFDIGPQPYNARRVKAAREVLQLSQSLFAVFLGVSENTIRAWEMGKAPGDMACRFMDEIILNPKYWRGRVVETLKTKDRYLRQRGVRPLIGFCSQNNFLQGTTTMKFTKLSIFSAMALAGLLFVGDSPATRADDAAPAASGFKSLFNGKDLTGWDGLEGFWSVKDGAISGAETKEHAAPQTFLIYKDKFGDFELHYKYKFATPDGNSGLQFRSKVLDEKQHRVGGYQADCDAKRGFDGSIYDEAGVAGGRGTMSNRGDKTTWDADTKRHNEKLSETADALKKLIKVGDWNDVVLVAKGNHITYTINGHLMTDLIDDSPKALKEGVIALQLHAGFVMDVQYKDIEIKDLSGG